MVYQEHLRLERKTIRFGTPALRELETTGKITPMGEKVQIELSLQNEDLRHRRFVIDEECTIFHREDVYQVLEHSFAKGRPHYVALYAKKIS